MGLLLVITPIYLRADDVDKNILKDLDFFMNLDLIKNREMLDVMASTSPSKKPRVNQPRAGEAKNDAK